MDVKHSEGNLSCEGREGGGGAGVIMSTTKVAMYVTFMFALAAAQDRTSQEVLKDLPLPWVVATLHFGAGMLWIFPAWVSD